MQAEFVEGARGCVHIQFPNTLCKHNMHCWSVCCIIPVRISNVCVCMPTVDMNVCLRSSEHACAHTAKTCRFSLL